MTRSSMLSRTRIRLGAAALGLALLSALALVSALSLRSRGEDPLLPPIRTQAPLLELLARPDLRRVVREDPDRPIQQDLVEPRGSGQGAYGALPAIRMAPPAELAYAVPKTHPDSVLRFALAIERGGYHGVGRVRFELELDGRPLSAHELRCDAELPGEQRAWYRFEAPIGAGGDLHLRCTYEGDQERAPSVAIGLLRVVVPFQVERAAARDGAPNVVLVLIDTLRADRLGAYGNPRRVSPAIDALAARGTLYERAFSSTPWTVPSTASVLSGLDPIEHGLGMGESYFLADSIETLPERFQQAGFTTAAFACNPLISPGRNFDQGFERFFESSWARSESILPDVEGWLRANADRRFFLYLHLVDPHYPYEPSPESSAGLVGAEPPGFIEKQLDHVLPNYYADPSVPLEPILASRDHQLDLYDAEVLDADRAVGHVVEVLRELGLEENTLVAVTADHGEEFLEHGWAGHHNQLFDESVRVPLVIAGPGVSVTRVAQPVENRFVGATLCGLAGVSPPKGRAGHSLARAEDLADLASNPVFAANSHGRWAKLERRELKRLGAIYSALHEGWRLVWSPATAKQEELLALFDLERDPGCERDVAEANPERAAHLRALVERWLAEGHAHQPSRTAATASTQALLRQIGYLGGGDER